MRCGVGADVGWLSADDRPQLLTAVMDDAEKERRAERYTRLSRQAWKVRYKSLKKERMKGERAGEREEAGKNRGEKA